MLKKLTRWKLAKNSRYFYLFLAIIRWLINGRKVPKTCACFIALQISCISMLHSIHFSFSHSLSMVNVIPKTLSPFFFVIFRRFLFIDIPIKDDWGTLRLGKKMMCFVKMANKIPLRREFQKIFSSFSSLNWQIYEPTKIYNSINRAKIINSFYPETIYVTQLFVNMHFSFLLSPLIPCYTFFIFEPR